MTPAVEGADHAAGVLTYLLERTTPEEQDRLFQGLRAIAVEGDRAKVRRFIEAFLVTIEVREHPDYRAQLEAFVRLVESGELFEGTPLAGVGPADIKAL
ncbi:MAG TPA: hypothetical protein VNO79_09215 [Actinomycetota bacterium]|nr:hypothetical protein [Actinomycetota bacterium]